MATAVQQSFLWAMGLVAFAVIGGLVLPPAAVLNLGIIAVSTIMGIAISLAAVIAVTGRAIW